MTVLADTAAEPNRLTSAQRVLSILGVFDTENLALSLSEISRRTGLTLSTGHDVIYVESLRGRDTVPVPSRLGGRWPMHATGTGLVLLANSSQEFQEEVLASKLRRYTANTLTDPDGLRHFLAEVRKSGVAIVEGQLTHDVMAEPPTGSASVTVATPSSVPPEAGLPL